MWFLHMCILFEDDLGCDLLVMNNDRWIFTSGYLGFWLRFLNLCDHMWVSRFAHYIESGNSYT